MPPGSSCRKKIWGYSDYELLVVPDIILPNGTVLRGERRETLEELQCKREKCCRQMSGLAAIMQSGRRASTRQYTELCEELGRIDCELRTRFG